VEYERENKPDFKIVSAKEVPVTSSPVFLE
jgi:hypothetical protein